MAPLVIPLTAQFRLIYNANALGPHQSNNVLHFRAPAPLVIDASTATTLAGFIATAWNAAGGIRGQQTASWTLGQVGVRDLRTANQPEFLASTGLSAGTRAGPDMPTEVALVTTLRTALSGPRYRGRVYHPGFSASDNTAGGVAGTTVPTAIQVTMNNLLAAMSGNGTPLVVASRKFLSSQEVTVVQTTNTWDTQRRRGRR